MLPFMRGGNLDADAGLTLCHDGIEKSGDENSFVLQARSKALRERRVVKHDWHDGVNAGLDVETGRCHSLAEILSVRFELVAEFRRCVEHSENFKRRARNWRRKRIRKKIWARTLAQHFDNLFPSRSKPSRRTPKR